MTRNEDCNPNSSAHCTTITSKGTIIDEVTFADWKDMRLGVVGLGHVGLPIANYFHEAGHEVFSWTRTERNVPWENSTNLTLTVDLDFIFIASACAFILIYIF